jgi:hypothetical protein
VALKVWKVYVPSPATFVDAKIIQTVLALNLICGLQGREKRKKIVHGSVLNRLGDAMMQIIKDQQKIVH